MYLLANSCSAPPDLPDKGRRRVLLLFNPSVGIAKSAICCGRLAADLSHVSCEWRKSVSPVPSSILTIVAFEYHVGVGAGDAEGADCCPGLPVTVNRPLRLF